MVLIRAAERKHGLPPIPILALTADAGAQARVEVLEAGYDGFHTKPIMLTSLVAALLSFGSPGSQGRRSA